ncbi:MAG TPA: hypothetical protein VD701_01970 [Steroidobacteraceae bacterium]|nr:hypothetical protein [Steroidobacteraceae bacterium]
MAAIALIVGGVLALAFGGFAYTRDTHQTRIGPVELTVTERQSVNVPVWAGAGAIIAGVLLVLRLKRRSG